MIGQCYNFQGFNSMVKISGECLPITANVIFYTSTSTSILLICNWKPLRRYCCANVNLGARWKHLFTNV